MATTRLLRTSKPTSFGTPSSQTSSATAALIRCVSKVGFNTECRINGDGERKPVVAVKAAVAAVAATSSVVTSIPGVDLASLLAIIRAAVLRSLKVIVKRRPWKLLVQMFITKVIIDCRFFTMFAVGGSLLGSVLCFVEGCFLVLESYLKYFLALSHKSDQGHIVHLLIEALDMFLVGTAMIIFGMGLHVMFVGVRNVKEKGSQLPASNLFGLFVLKELPSWVGMKSITQAKLKIGHALMMLLQVGVLEKFKSIPLVTGLDLACFAGAVFVSSAGLFILSRLSIIVHDGTIIQDTI